MTKLTKAQLSALQSVKSGRCYRKFNARGNTLHSEDGCKASVLWRLEWLGMIDEGRSLTKTKAILFITDAGRAALREQLS